MPAIVTPQTQLHALLHRHSYTHLFKGM